VTVVTEPKRSLKERLSAHFAEYGKFAIYTYLTLSLLAIAGFSIAIGLGFGASSATGIAGTIGAGWLAAKATMPLRILATLALTPLVAMLWRKWRPAPADDDAEPAADE
jgi:membrane protein implicated in regulation of membrane protease activity